MICNLNYIVLADNDGTIRDTNGVKDAMLNDFCVAEFGEMPSGKQLPTEIHRQMHGRPMNEIFVEIARSIYAKEISLEEGQRVTERLNDFIRPEYVSRPVYDGAKEFYQKLKEMGIPLYILTGMEPDMVQDGLNYFNMQNMFLDVLGAPKTKEQNIAEVRTITGLGLKEAKDLVDGAPKTIKEGVAKAEAEEMKKKLEEAGAKVELK